MNLVATVESNPCFKISGLCTVRVNPNASWPAGSKNGKPYAAGSGYGYSFSGNDLTVVAPGGETASGKLRLDTLSPLVPLHDNNDVPLVPGVYRVDITNAMAKDEYEGTPQYKFSAQSLESVSLVRDTSKACRGTVSSTPAEAPAEAPVCAD